MSAGKDLKVFCSSCGIRLCLCLTVSVVKSKGKVPWMSYKAAKLVRKKHRVFKKYKDKNHPACKRSSRVASCEVKKANKSIILRGSWQRISKRILSRFMLT